jgi:hypothetical protein
MIERLFSFRVEPRPTGEVALILELYESDKSVNPRFVPVLIDSHDAAIEMAMKLTTASIAALAQHEMAKRGL